MLCKNCVKTTVYLNKFKIIKSSIIPKFSRLCSTVEHENLTEWNNIKSKFTDEQLKLVLKTLNRCNLKEMNKFHIADSHIKIFESLKKENKTVVKLDDLIALDTLKVSELESICSAICSFKKVKSKGSIVTPAIKANDLENINTAVGLRIGCNYLSWSHLESTGSHCNILNWHCHRVSELPLNASPAEVIKMAVDVAKDIPIADAYVLEKDGSKPLSKINTSIYRILLRQQQMISIVLTSLSIRYQSEHPPENASDDFFKRFYMMKAFAPAQLFNLFVGSEIVSTTDIVESLFQQENVGLQNILSISTEGKAAKLYASLDLYQKEELHKSLLLVLAFFESAVLQTRNDLYQRKRNS